jgi:hypothetical protein
MAFPSRVQGAGQSGGATTAICGDVQAAVTAAGSSATDALSVSAVVVRSATTASGTGVKLPAPEAGAMMVVRNDGAETLTVYPPTGSTIDGAASVTIVAAKASLFFGTSPTTWVSLAGA